LNAVGNHLFKEEKQKTKGKINLLRNVYMYIYVPFEVKLFHLKKNKYCINLPDIYLINFRLGQIAYLFLFFFTQV
jgi:hypothetical protein